MEKMDLFKKGEDPNTDSALVGGHKIAILSWKKQHVVDISLSLKGEIVLEFADGIVLRDSVSVVFDRTLTNGVDPTVAELRDLYYDEVAEHWINSRLQLLSVVYKNILTAAGSSLDPVYDFKDRIPHVSTEIVKLAANGYLTDTSVISTPVPEQECIGEVEDLINLEKGLMAKLTVRLKTDGPLGYLGYFRGYYLQVSGTDDGIDDRGHSDRVYPNLDNAVHWLGKYSTSIAEQYLKIQVIDCLSEARFNWAEIAKADDKINMYVMAVLPNMNA